MSDTDEATNDSDTFDEWQDYYASDHEDEVLDDDKLPPVIVNEDKCKTEQCLICFEDLDNEIGALDVCDHMFCLKCITLWSTLSKTCPEDGREFSQILKFVRREDKIMYQHEKGVNISCRKSGFRTLRQQNPKNSEETQRLHKFIRHLKQQKLYRESNRPEPVWRYRNKKGELSGGQGINYQNLSGSSKIKLPACKVPQEGRSIYYEHPSRPEIQQDRLQSSCGFSTSTSVCQQERSQSSGIFQIPELPEGLGEGYEFGNRIGCQVRRRSKNRVARRRCPTWPINFLNHSAILNPNEDIHEEQSSSPLEDFKHCNLHNAHPHEDGFLQHDYVSLFSVKKQNVRLRGDLKEFLPPTPPGLESEVD